MLAIIYFIFYSAFKCLLRLIRLRNFNVECFSDFISLYILTLDEPFLMHSEDLTYVYIGITLSDYKVP